MTPTLHIWRYRGLFVAICLVLVTLKLLPINLQGGTMPGPDLILALTFAWLMRHPALVPVALIAVVFLMADFLLQRPPGLWTALVIIAAEVIRRRRVTMVDVPILVEWAAFAGVVLGLLIVNRMALWLLVVEAPAFGPSFVHAVVTVLVYPVVAGISHYVLRVPRLSPGELELS